MRLTDLIQVLKRNGPMSASEIAEASGCGITGVRRAISVLSRQGYIVVDSVKPEPPGSCTKVWRLSE